MLRTYSFSEDILSGLERNHLTLPAIKGLKEGIPFVMAESFARQIFDSGIFPCSTDAFTDCEAVVHCLSFQAKPMPTADDWKKAYDADHEMKLIMANLENPSNWTRKELLKVSAPYRVYIRNNAIAIRNGRLVVFQQLEAEGRQQMLIVVPRALRLMMFAAYHEPKNSLT